MPSFSFVKAVTDCTYINSITTERAREIGENRVDTKANRDRHMNMSKSKVPTQPASALPIYNIISVRFAPTQFDCVQFSESS